MNSILYHDKNEAHEAMVKIQKRTGQRLEIRWHNEPPRGWVLVEKAIDDDDRN